MAIARGSLRAILDGACEHTSVNSLVKVCHALAVPYVRRRLSGDVVLRRTLELNIGDLSYDCLADLFAFADSGEFPHFQAYFAAYPPDMLSDQEVLVHLRRLVFSHVNQGIFRVYNEVDPSLGKIIRNIKLALQQFDSLVLIERFGVPCLAPAEGDRMLQNRNLEIEEVEAGLRGYIRGRDNIPYMLGKLALFLHETYDVCRVVPLTHAAIVFRSIYTTNAGDDAYASSVEENVDVSNLKEVVREAVEEVRKRMSPQYLRKKKMHPSLLDVYFKVIEERMRLTFSGDGSEKGLKELLGLHLDGMTDNEYKANHRSRLEYLSRLTGEEVARKLKMK
ncbi:MAG: hypothetical protein M1339_01915 [Bacteroidetes bacterium]|nr:hypothetical protein [Bacteroidota bacterium]